MRRLHRRSPGQAGRARRRLACALVPVLIGGGGLVSACGSGDSSGPLAADVAQRGYASCVPAPDPGTGGIKAWDTPIGFALDMFVNTSRSPIKVESVALMDPHGLILHGALVYEMAHSRHPLIEEDAWGEMGTGVPAALWQARQAVPGAIIPRGHPVTSFKPAYSLNLYEIVPDVSDATPNGGWALGEAVKYESEGHTWTVRAYTGLAIGYSPARGQSFCTAQIKAINDAFKTAGGSG